MKDDDILRQLQPQATELAISINQANTERRMALEPNIGFVAGEMLYAQNLLSLGIDTTNTPQNVRTFGNSAAEGCQSANDVLGSIALGALPNAAPTGADAFIVEDGALVPIESKVIYLDSNNFYDAWKVTLSGRLVREYADGTVDHFMTYHGVKFKCATLSNMETKARDTFMILVDKGPRGLTIVAVYRMDKETVMDLIAKSPQGQRLLRGDTSGSAAIEITMAEFIRNSELYEGRYSLPQIGLDTYMNMLTQNCNTSYHVGETVENANAHLEYLQHLLSGNDAALVKRYLNTPGLGVSRADLEYLWGKVLGVDPESVLWSMSSAAPINGKSKWKGHWHDEPLYYTIPTVGKSKEDVGVSRPGTKGHEEIENGKLRDYVHIGYYGKPGHERIHVFVFPHDYYNNHAGYNLRIPFCKKTLCIKNYYKISRFNVELPISSLQEARDLAAPVATKFTVSQNGMGIHREV